MTGTLPFDVDADRRRATLDAAAHRDHGQSRQSRTGLPRPRCCRNDGRRAGAHGVHHQRAHRRSPDGARSSREGRVGRGAGSDRTAGAQLRDDRPISSSNGCRRASARSPPRSIPKPVIVRLSDFKTNEYAQPDRRRGVRAARRRIRCSAFAARRAMPTRPMPTGFALECAALRRVRERDGPDQSAHHGAVLPTRGAKARRVIDDDGRPRPRSAAKTGSRSTSCAKFRTM